MDARALTRRKELGDFQTPPDLADTCLQVLTASGPGWQRMLEPTCGTGAFLAAATDHLDQPLEMIGIDIQPAHIDQARRQLTARPGPAAHWRVEIGDVFTHDLAALPWVTDGPLLVAGNPPWVTFAELGALGSGQSPRRINVRRTRGIGALTGDSNADVAEYIWLRLLTELADQRPTIALLCKTSVARRVLTLAARLGIAIERADLWPIDARRHFDVAVDACLFSVQVGAGDPPGSDDGPVRCQVHRSLDDPVPTTTMAVVNGALVADLLPYLAASHHAGRSPITWRQGVKHDLAAIMELQRHPDGSWRNGLGEVVDIEPDRTHPLSKGADLHSGRPPSRKVVVSQRSLADDTSALRTEAPLLWRYLDRHRDRFEARRSKIYLRRPPFALFGVGPYTFTGWKVAVSGLHKNPHFRLIGPEASQPVLFDDTSYYVACPGPGEAAVIAAIMESEPARRLLATLLFPDAKRPVTKKLLQQIDLYALLTGHRDEVETRAITALRAVGPKANIGPGEPADTVGRAADRLLSQWADAVGADA